MTQPLVAMRGVCKAFGGVRAVDHADLDLAAGEALGLEGMNGGEPQITTADG